MRTSTPHSATSIGPCGPKWTASAHASAPALVRELDDAPRRPTSVPTAFDATGKATTLCALGELALEVAEVERRVLVDVDEAHLEALVVRELEPGRHVRVVVEPRDDDLVSLAATRGPRCA